MKARVISVLIICVLILEGCAVISKSDYTVASNAREDVLIPISNPTPGIFNSSEDVNNTDPSSSETDDMPETGNVIDDIPENNENSDSETHADNDENSDNSAEGVSDGVPVDENTESEDTASENNDTGNTDNNENIDLNENNTPAGDNSQKSEDTSGSENTEKSETENTTYVFPKDNSDKSYRKEEDIIIPASELDRYIADFDKLAPSSVMSFNELVGDNGDYDLPKGFPKAGTYKIIVDLYYQVVMAFAKDENGDYTVPVRYMLCSSGLSSSPTRTGVFKLKSYRVRFGLFNNTSVYAQYWSQIDGRMYFHSILYTERKAESYNTSFNNLGKKSSHGCVRLSVPDARWIWYNAAPGTTVVVRKGSSDDVVTAKIKELLTLDKMPSNRPEHMSGSAIPYTDNWTIDTVPHEVDFIQGSQDNS